MREMEREKILVIDDEEFILDIVREVLTKMGFDVTITPDGYKGLSLLRREKFSLMMTDIRMPDITGLELIQHVREWNKEIPIIIITGHGTLEVAIKALKMGAQGFLLKPFTIDELRTAVADALEKTLLLNENIRMRALMPLFEVNKEIISETDTKRLLGLITGVVVRETRADRAFLFLYDEQAGSITMETHHGFPLEFIHDFKEKHVHTLMSLLRNEKKPVLVVPGAEVPAGFEEIPGVRGFSNIYTPLSVRGSHIGVIGLSRSASERPFSLSDLELVSVLSGQAAVAIENARLYEKLQQSYLSTIVTLSGIAESKDFYTDKHMKDISEFAVEIARRLGLPDAEVEHIRMAALLHDLGKISVPDDILKKPGKLTAEEMAVIRNHPARGAKMLEAIEPLREAREIILHHHEYFDGSGYPDGLKGKDIPLGARIIAVADAFDAMTTNRPYRKALPMDKVLQELRDFSGRQFDPAIVEILLSILRERGLIDFG